MKTAKFLSIMRGLASVTASIMTLSVAVSGIADSYRVKIDDFMGTQSYVVNVEEDSARFISDYETFEDMKAAAKAIAVREGEEGTVIMKNDNNVLPLSGKNVVLFGVAAYAPYPYESGDLKAGNADAVDLVQAFQDAGVEINQTMIDFYENDILNEHTGFGGQISYDGISVSAPGDMTTYQVNEIPPSEYGDFGVSSGWEADIDKDSTVGVCVFARGAGEGNTYAPGSAVNYAGEETGEDPLALSADELSVIDKAKDTCSQVVVLINSGNTMVLTDIAEGGEHEVDGIAYIGCLNDYQAAGIVNVLTGQINSTGALPDTYVADNASIPAVQNFGGGYYADYEIVATDGEDPRYPEIAVENHKISSFGGMTPTYNGGTYIVEAEGIYVGYKYYETRYYDSITNLDSGAASSAGATQDDTWDYDAEVIYDFGHGLSYLDYTQELKSIDVDCTEDGDVTAVVAVTNNSNQDGRFLAQLYAQQPYTDYDRKNNVEKSAVMFLNSAKVEVAAGATEEVIITIPAKYLASYDYTNAKTYILDEGDYYFTAAAGSHEAVNNILAAQGYTTADGMDEEAAGAVQTWNLAQMDNTTFSISNDTEVTNVADDADLNYWTEDDTVTYLTRQDWEGTYPVNYNEVELNIGDSPKSEEWIAELRGETYTIQDGEVAAEGTDNGLRFDTENIQYEQLEDLNDPFWAELVAQITIDEAVGAVIHGGSQTDTLTNIDNPVVVQNEGVNGFTAAYTDEETGETYRFNVHSQTLLGSSFNPELAYDWGRVEGNSGLWLKRYHLWGVGLTQRRTPYNGRNYEYLSEDPMLTNRMGYGVLQGCADMGIINGPKHMGFNDQEHNRAGISVYMNEQKFRETDLRCFQGGLDDADGKAVMVALNRIGATNASHYAPMIQTLLRGEWGYTGIVSTDMMTNQYYFEPGAMVMAGITQTADFAAEDGHINMGEGGTDATWAYISEESVANDSALVNQARENLKYQLYTFANSAVMNVSTERVQTWWDNAITTVTYVSGALTLITLAAWIMLTVRSEKKKEEK